MLLLAELPNDIVLNVLTCLTNDPRSLRSLSVSGKWLYSLALPLLYRHVHLNLRRIDALLLYGRTVSKRPDLALLTRDLKLTLPKGRLTKVGRQVLSHVNLLLGLLPNVRSFGLQLLRGFDDTFILGRINASFLSALHSFSIGDRSLDIFELFRWLPTQNIRTLHVENLQRLQLTEMPKLGSVELPLTSLSFGSSVYIQADQLRKVLQMTPRLAKLVCNIPVSEKGERLTWMLTLDPGSIAHALEPVQGSLTQLYLRAGAWPYWCKEDEPDMDLSDFHNLKYLSAPSRCFEAAKDRRDSSNTGLYPKLPSDLENLDMHFDMGADDLHHWEVVWEDVEGKGQLKFWAPSNERETSLQRTELANVLNDPEIDDAEIERYTSIEGMALRKERYPLPRHVTMGPEKIQWSPAWDSHQWDIIVRLKDAPFQLRVLLRNHQSMAAERDY